MANWGDVIAQGVLQGIGDTGMRYVEDMRRTRMNERKMNQSMDLFKRQSLFTQKQKTLEQMNASAEEWKQAAQMDTGQLAYNVAMKMTDGFAKGDRAKAFRDSMKRLNGKSKQELLAIGGYTQPDYSQFVSDPDFMDAIPSAAISGMDPAQYGMDQVFKYDPNEYANLAKEALDKMTDYQRRVKREREIINSSVITSGLATGVSDKLADLIQSNIGQKDPIQEGKDMRTQYLNTLINAGRVATDPETGKLILVNELPPMDEEGDVDVTPTEASGAFVADPEAAQRAEDERMEKQRKVYQTDSKAMGKTLQKEEYLPVIRSIEEAKDAIDSLSPDAKDYIFGLKAVGGEFIRKAAAKALGDEDAEAAGEALRKLAQIRNIVLLQRSGAAVTDPEMQRFVEELNQPGALTSENALKAGLDNLVRLNVDGIKSSTAGYDEESVNYFLETPSGREYARYLQSMEGDGETEDEQETPETSTESPEEAPMEPQEAPEGAPMEPQEAPEEREQPSIEGVIQYVDKQIAAGAIDQDDRQRAIQHIANKLGLTLGVSR